uniref:Uncharacterized protein n=1 Tax=Anguilla anguilla TaxID=7936 RepID=A0A0E9RSU3_ANGAN
MQLLFFVNSQTQISATATLLLSH